MKEANIDAEIIKCSNIECKAMYRNKSIIVDPFVSTAVNEKEKEELIGKCKLFGFWYSGDDNVFIPYKVINEKGKVFEDKSFMQKRSDINET